MAAGSTAVSVLAPNGRRQTVKVSPNTTLLQVLEEVCRKQGFDPDDHGLKFQRNVLNLTLQWRFASLPNNAKLEVVPCSQPRGGTESSVRIALQLEDGSRLQDSFSCSQSLWELLNHFPQTRISELDVPGSTPICVYMRDEVSGEEALKMTTLKSLGLTGGSAILRYALKTSKTLDPNEPVEIAAMPNEPSAMATSSPPPAAVNAMPLDSPAAPPAPVPETMPGAPSQSPNAAAESCQQQVVRPKTKPQESRTEYQTDEEQAGPSHDYNVSSANFVPFSGDGQKLGGSGSDELSNCASSTALSSSPPKAKKAKASHEAQVIGSGTKNANHLVTHSARATCGAKDSDDAEDYSELMEREPLVFHLDTASQRHSNSGELPDEFFEVTVDDIRKRFSQLKSERKALEEAPLMTQSLRETQTKEKMDRYPKVVLRVQFPDRRVLQGFFRPLETVAELRRFVRNHLQHPEFSFYLFIAPPKTMLDDPNATLFQANLFPAALVHFGSDVKTDCYLRSDLVDSSISALQADELIAGSMPRSSNPSSSSLPPEDSLSLDTELNGAHSTQQDPKEDSDSEQNQAPKPVRTDPAKVPKWFKLPGKK